MGLGFQGDETFRICASPGYAERAITGFNPLAGVSSTVPLAYQAVQSRQFFVHDIRDVNEYIVVKPALRSPYVAGYRSRARAEENRPPPRDEAGADRRDPR